MVKKNGVVGILVGLIIAIASAILLDYVKHTIKSSKDIVENLGITPLGTIPDLGSKKKLINPDPQRSMEGSFAFIRDYLKNLNTSNDYKTILVASTEKGEGKKFVASNLALTYAVEENSAVLVQANLRDPRDISDLKPNGAESTNGDTPGFWEYLEGRTDLDSILYGTHIDNLDIIMPGKPGPTNPMKLFQSERMAELLHELNKRYGLTVLITAEASKFSDAAAVASLMDGILMVIEYDKLSVDKIKQAIGRMNAPGASLLGAVINKEKKYGWKLS